MSIEDVLGQFVTELNRIRREHGEEAYRTAAKNAAKMALGRGGNAERFMRGALKDVVDFDEIQRERNAEFAPPPRAAESPKPPPPEAPPADEAMAKAIMGQIPGCETQAQFNAMLACFDALRLLLTAIFTGNKESEFKSREAFDRALEVAVTATVITEKLRDVPEAATGPGTEDFKKPPVQFHEHDVLRGLLAELETVTALDALNEWYKFNRSRMDLVVSPNLRNVLFDAIKAKKDDIRQQQSD